VSEGESDSTASGSRISRREPGLPPARLTVVFPPGLSGAIDLDGRATIVGRSDEGTQLRIEHPTLSRRHAAVLYRADLRAYVCRDLASRNGTQVDGVALSEEPRALADGSVLRLGDVLLVFETGAALQACDSASVSRAAVPGAAATVVRLRGALERAAVDRAPVLVIGETGTGKESISREIHRLSGRRGPMLAVNCAALAANLVESELFGYVKGAFTGAEEARPGLLRSSDGGSLLLDEVGDLPVELQPKLLRALQEGEVQPVGGVRGVRVDVRVVAATHRELSTDAGAGRFRSDLYARLSMWEVRVPSLRERRVDLLDWLERIAALWRADHSDAAPIDERGESGEGVRPHAIELTVDAAEALLLARWTLNLRGLERLVRELSTREQPGEPVTLADLPSWVLPAAPAAPAAVRAAPVPARDEFIAAYDELKGSVRGLARRFQRDRRQIYRWVDAYGLKRG
jgi:transcriptional regulator with GAF, ATPase, and Fis domain